MVRLPKCRRWLVRPNGGGHAGMTPEEWGGSSGALNGNGWIHYGTLRSFAAMVQPNRPNEHLARRMWYWPRRPCLWHQLETPHIDCS